MPLAMSPDFTPAPTDVRRIRAILDQAAEAGIRVVLCHDDGAWPQLTKKARLPTWRS